MTNKPARERDVVERRCPACSEPIIVRASGQPDDLVKCGCTIVSLEWLTAARELLEAPSPQPDTDVVERVATIAEQWRSEVLKLDDARTSTIYGGLSPYAIFGPAHVALKNAGLIRTFIPEGTMGLLTELTAKGIKIAKSLRTQAALNASTPEIQRLRAEVRLAMQALSAFGDTEEGVTTAYNILKDVAQ